MREPREPHWLLAAAGVGLILAAGVLVYIFLHMTNYVPGAYDRYFEAALIAVFGVVAILFLGRALRRKAQKRLGADRAYRVLDVYRVVAYVIVALLVLSVLGVSGTALLAGGTFAGLVIGLAAQTALGNVIAGLMLLVVRPFREGDRVTVATWQYAFLGPAYPPKFYSDDLLVLGFTGTVHSIGLAYSQIRRDDGTSVRFPNNVLIQAAVLSHEVTQRWVRAKYEVPPQVDPKVLLPLARECLAKNEWVVQPETVQVTVGAATMSSYVVVVDAVCRGAFEDGPRSALLVDLIDLVGGLKAQAMTRGT